MDPIIQNNVKGFWECFINIDDRTNTWGHKESERDRDITDLLSDWVPLDEEIEKVDKTAEAYKMKGYEWQKMKWVFLVLFVVLIAYSIKDELDKEKNE